jgi:hypothetical protein
VTPATERKRRMAAAAAAAGAAELPECCVCLDEIEDRGRVDSCPHDLCFPCVKKWCDVTNLCPMCKRTITRIERVHERSGNPIPTGADFEAWLSENPDGGAAANTNNDAGKGKGKGKGKGRGTGRTRGTTRSRASNVLVIRRNKRQRIDDPYPGMEPEEPEEEPLEIDMAPWLDLFVGDEGDSNGSDEDWTPMGFLDSVAAMGMTLPGMWVGD